MGRHRGLGGGARKVLVIGSGGAGKTTFARELARRTGLPLIHLDALYWGPGWAKPPKEAWAATVDRLLAGERWIMDGNYGGTLGRRLAACDTVIFLDLSRLLCLWRIMVRRVRYAGRTRPDLHPGCPERLTLEYLRFVWTYPSLRRPEILRKLAGLRDDQEAVVLDSPGAANRYLRST